MLRTKIIQILEKYAKVQNVITQSEVICDENIQ